MEYKYWDVNTKEWVEAPPPEGLEDILTLVNENEREFEEDEFEEDEFVDEIVAYDVPVQTDQDNLLPFGTRYTERRDKNIYYLIEVKPRIVTFKYNHDPYDYAASDEYEVAVPWEYYWLHFQEAPLNAYGISTKFINSQLLWAQERMVSLASLAYPAKLPNTGRSPDDYYYSRYGAGHMCLGTALYHLIEGNSATLAEISETLVENFYDGKFNDNMDNGYPYPFGDANIWAEESAKDPYGWMTWQELIDEPKDSIRNLIRYEL